MFSFLWLVIKRAGASFKFKIQRQFLRPVKPWYINLSLTYLCNGRCQMCGNWKRYLDQPQKLNDELSFKDYEKFFQNNKDWLSDLKHIGIAGGEPFLRTDLVSLVELIHRELPKVSIGLQSNGLFPEKIGHSLSEIVKFYPEITLAVSLDGIGKTHDKIRGIKGAYQKVLKTIELAKKAGVKEISCGMTIQEDNFKEIPKVKEVVENQGAEFSCFLADAGEYYNTKRRSDLGGKAKKSVIQSLKNFRGDYYLDNLRLQMEGKRKRSLPCYSGWTSLVIDPYGEIRPCVLRSDSFGN
ncbi:MAG: radical SAM/SPASM domain-containing protein, partial [Microgenomates group bacterium]